MQLIVLWDIDHTLIENAGVSKEIYAEAFRIAGGGLPSRPAVTQGRTDRSILAEMFRDHGLEAPAWEHLAAALQRAGAEHESELARRGQALPGAREALKAVAAEPGMISSVLTGNIFANAQVKLRAFGLDRFLDLECGAYGSHSEDRTSLVKVARDNIGTTHDLPNETPVVLIGDTPLDVRAALETGSEVIAVASGIHDAAELRDAGAPVVLDDLKDLPRLMGILRTMRRSH